MSKYKPNKTLYITNHRKPDSERVEHDFYATHPDSVRTFLDEFLKGHSIKYAWEPACGLGNIADVLKEYEIFTYATDLIDRDYQWAEEGGRDFLKEKDIDPKIDTIITNPPFKLSTQFIKKALELKPKRFVIMYLKLLFLEGKKRYQLFKDFPPAEIWIHSSRQGCSPFGETEFDNGGSVAYAWFVWRTDKLGPAHPNVFWLPPNS